jgi:hypothetical protein
MSPSTCQASWRLTPLRSGLWERLTTRRSRLLGGRQFHQTPDAGRSAFLTFTPSSRRLTVFLPVSLPTRTTVTSTFFSLISLLPVVVLPPGSTSASSRHCLRSAPRELRPTPVLPRGHSSIATASNSMQRSGSSAEVLTYAGSPCTNNSAMNKTPNPCAAVNSEEFRAGAPAWRTASLHFMKTRPLQFTLLDSFAPVPCRRHARHYSVPKV